MSLLQQPQSLAAAEVFQHMMKDDYPGAASFVWQMRRVADQIRLPPFLRVYIRPAKLAIKWPLAAAAIKF